MITPGKYGRDQIQGMGLNFDEITSAQTVGGRSYKLDNPGDGSRVVREVSLVGAGQGSGGFTNLNSTPSMGAGFNQPAIDLPKMYQNLYDTSGIKQKEAELSQKERDYINVEAGINDNPFLSEGTRVGRVEKLSDTYQKRTANLKNDIATAKADIETKLNLETKQFDINSQQAQLALQQFNSLIGMGALDGASGDDIANITRSTGLSSSMVQGAIQANKNKNLQTSVESYDDGVNEGYRILTVDNAGNIVSVKSQPVGPSQKKQAAAGFDSAGFMRDLMQQSSQTNDLWALWNSIPD